MRKHWIAPALIVAAALFGLIVWPFLPGRVATHWNASGNADGYSSRTLAIVLTPAIALATWLLLVLLPRIDPRKANYASFSGTYTLIVNAVVAFIVAAHVLILVNGLGLDIQISRVVLVGVGLLLAVIGNELGRVKPNWFAGIRTPWTLSNDEVWRRTHQVGARIMVILGIVTIVLGIFAPLSIATIFIAVGVPIVLLGVAAYSYVIYKDIDGRSHVHE